MEQKKTTTITFRATKELKEDLEKMAAGENRKTANLIESILLKAVEAFKKKKTNPTL